MILWRVHALSNWLKERPLTGRESLPYLIAALVAATLVFVSTDWSRPRDRDEFGTGVDSLTTIINGLVGVIGLYAWYRANGVRLRGYVGYVAKGPGRGDVPAWQAVAADGQA